MHGYTSPPSAESAVQTVETERGNDDYKRYQSTQKQLLKEPGGTERRAGDRDSEVSRYRMIQEQVDPIAWLQKDLKVEFIESSEVMEISLSGEYPQEVAGIVNAVSKPTSTKSSIRTRRTERPGTPSSRAADAVQSNAERAAGHPEETRRNVGSDDRQTLAYSQQIAMEHHAYVRRELADVQSQKRKLQARLKVKGQRPQDGLEEPSAPSVSDADIDEWIERDPSVANLAAKLAEDEDRLKSETLHVRNVARKGARDQSLKHMQNEVQELRKELGAERAELRPEAIRTLERKGSSDQAETD